MAKRNSTELVQVSHCDPSIESIIKMMEYHVENIDKKLSEILALSLCGESWAGRPDSEGNEVEMTSRLMFGVVREKAEEAADYYALIENIGELRARLAQQAAEAA